MKITIKELRKVIREAYGNRYVPSGKGCTIYLPTDSAIALWQDEITGQLSDGKWENSKPWEHWKFWCELSVAKGAPRVECTGGYALKNSYNLTGLIEYVGDRMVATGRAASVGATSILRSGSGAAGAAEYMPKTFDDWKRRNDGNPLSLSKYQLDKLDQVSEKDAQKFYASTYGMKDLKRDLQLIKIAMKSAPM